MRRLLAFLLIFSFVATSASAPSIAACRHADADAHAAALRSADKATSFQAHAEDDAADTAQGGGFSLGGSSVLASAILPTMEGLPVSGGKALAPWPHVQPTFAGRTDQPPLPPPLA